MVWKYRSAFLLFLLLLLPSLLTAQGTADFFPKFRGDLDAVLAEHGLDPQHQTFHIMLLLNSVKTDGPEAEGMEKIVHELLTNYLVPGDIVSIAAYELHVRDDASTWEQPFRPENATQLEHCLPTAPQIRSDGTSKGHDQEAALLEALGRLTDKSDLPVVVVLSPTRDSQHPDIPVNYRLRYEMTDVPAALKQFGYLAAPITESAHASVVSSKLRRTIDATLFYRFYLPDALAATGRLTNQTRQDLLAGQNRQAVINQQLLRIIVIILTIILLAGLLIGLAIAIYKWWQHRQKIHGQSQSEHDKSSHRQTCLLKIGPELRTLRLGHALYVGGANCGAEEENVALQHIMAGVRVAEISLVKGQVIVRGVGQYVPLGTLSAQGIPVGSQEQLIAFQLSNGQQTYEFTIRTVE